MAQDVLDSSAKNVMSSSWKAFLGAVFGLMLSLSGSESAQATTGVGPYEVPQVLDSNADPNIVET